MTVFFLLLSSLLFHSGPINKIRPISCGCMTLNINKAKKKKRTSKVNLKIDPRLYTEQILPHSMKTQQGSRKLAVNQAQVRHLHVETVFCLNINLPSDWNTHPASQSKTLLH